MHPPAWAKKAVGWLRKVWKLLEELRTHEQKILSQRDLLVRELRQNAKIAERFAQQQTSTQSVQNEIFALPRFHGTSTFRVSLTLDEAGPGYLDGWSGTQRVIARSASSPCTGSVRVRVSTLGAKCARGYS